MERNPAMQAAEDAVRWAEAPCPDGTHRNNYARLLTTICCIHGLHRGAAACTGWLRGGAFDALSVALSTGMGADMWPCLSRLLVMDEPALAGSVRIAYDAALDSQAGVAWLRIRFPHVAGRPPAVRSWRCAREAAGL